MNRIHVVSRLRAQRQLIAADAPRRACRQPEGIKAASDRFAIRFVITSGAGAPTGLSSVVSNAAARRIVVATTVAATAALAPSRYSTSGPPGRQYLLGTARSCSCTAYDIPLVVTTVLNARQVSDERKFRGFLGGQVGVGLSLFFSPFGAVSIVKCIPIRCEGPSTPRVVARRETFVVRNRPRPVYVA